MVLGGRISRNAGATDEGVIIPSPMKPLLGKFLTVRDGVIEFFKGDGTAADVILRRSGTSTLYVNGNVSTSGTVTTAGNLSVTGTMTSSGKVTGSNSPVDRIRTSDSSAVNNSDVLVSDDVMTASLAVGTYIAEGMILYNADADADLKLRFNTTGTMTAVGTCFSLTGTATTSGTGTISTLMRANNSDFTVGAADSSGNLNLSCAYRLIITVTVAGVFTVQYAQATANASNLVVMAGSYLSIRTANTP